MNLKNSVLFASFLILGQLFILTGCAGNPKTRAANDARKSARVTYLSELAVPGCEGEKIKPKGDLKAYVEDQLSHYGFFVDKDEKKILERCKTVGAASNFFTKFWFFRDPDKSTPENEYKNIIDERIADIKNEILFNDMYVAGTRFAPNGGLKGDMAHVYLLRGNNSYKVKTGHLNRLADLMAWVYFDVNQRPLYVFLFYNKGGGYRLFRSHQTMDSYEGLLEVLRELSKFSPVNEEDYREVYNELIRNDPEYIFRFAINRFSYYEDVKLDKVLFPPTPEVITAKMIQPQILGRPDIPSDMKMVFGPRAATILGRFILVYDGNRYTARLVVDVGDIDWEDLGERLSATFDLSIEFTNEETRESKVFYSGLALNMTRKNYENVKGASRPLDLGGLVNHEEGAGINLTISDFIKKLTSGNYSVKIELVNKRTFKSNLWFTKIKVK